jgi:solute carrier family 35 protein F3/4
MYTRALTVIEASDVTAIFSSAPAFVFLLSLILLREPPLILRLFAVLLAVGGIVVFACEDGFNSSGNKLDSATGVALSIGAAVGAAFYKVLLKVRVRGASIYQMSLFLSSLGLFSTLFLWPVVLTLQVTHTEVIAGPDVKIPWLFLSASSALSVLFNFSINFGIAYTYPLFISLGTVLSIPVNALVDLLARRVNLFSTWKFAAVDLIVAGFLLMLLPPRDSRWIHRTFCCCSTCCCSRRVCKSSCDNTNCVR